MYIGNTKLNSLYRPEVPVDLWGSKGGGVCGYARGEGKGPILPIKQLTYATISITDAVELI